MRELRINGQNDAMDRSNPGKCEITTVGEDFFTVISTLNDFECESADKTTTSQPH